jgi:hypothetical protein
MIRVGALLAPVRRFLPFATLTLSAAMSVASSPPPPEVQRAQGPEVGPEVPVLLDKFRGAMVGAVIGDCLGAPLEFESDRALSSKRIRRQFDEYAAAAPTDAEYLYTDDTAMARGAIHQFSRIIRNSDS